MKSGIQLALTVLFFACASPEKNNETAVQTQQPEIVNVVEYYDSGVVKKRGKSKAGKRIGTWETFYPNGYRWSELVYEEGYRQGPTITYYPNGMMRYQGQYTNDEKAGLWQFYDTTGVLITRINMDTISTESSEVGKLLH